MQFYSNGSNEICTKRANKKQIIEGTTQQVRIELKTNLILCFGQYTGLKQEYFLSLQKPKKSIHTLNSQSLYLLKMNFEGQAL